MEQGKILIVEDEAITALDIESMLTDIGYNVIPAVATGEAAVEVAQQELPNLILMDIKLKGSMDGITAAGIIWDKLHIPTIFLTSYSDEKTLARAKLIQPYGYILKPFDSDELRTTVELALFRIKSSTGETPSDRQVVPTYKNTEYTLGTKTLSTFQFLKRIETFRDLSDQLIESLANGSEFKELKAEQNLISEGSQDNQCYIIGSGRLACVKSSVNGKELVVSLLAPGNILPLILALSDTPFPFSIRVERDSKILIVPKKTLLLVLDEHPNLYKDFNEVITEYVYKSFEMSRKLAHEKVKIRIATALTDLIENFGKFDSEQQQYALYLTRQELSDMVGTTPETAIRVTRSLENAKLLDLSEPGRIIIKDIQALEKLFDDLDE